MWIQCQISFDVSRNGRLALADTSLALDTTTALLPQINEAIKDWLVRKGPEFRLLKIVACDYNHNGRWFSGTEWTAEALTWADRTDPLTIAYMSMGAAKQVNELRNEGYSLGSSNGGFIGLIKTVIAQAAFADSIAHRFECEHPGVWCYDVAEPFGKSVSEFVIEQGPEDLNPSQLLKQAMLDADYPEHEIDAALLHCNQLLSIEASPKQLHMDLTIGIMAIGAATYLAKQEGRVDMDLFNGELGLIEDIIQYADWVNRLCEYFDEHGHAGVWYYDIVEPFGNALTQALVENRHSVDVEAMLRNTLLAAGYESGHVDVALRSNRPEGTLRPGSADSDDEESNAGMRMVS